MEKDIVIDCEGLIIYGVELKYVCRKVSSVKDEDIRLLKVYKGGVYISTIRLKEYRLKYVYGDTVSKIYRVVER